MSEVLCPRCGYDDVAVVRKEPMAGGGYKRKYRCPRCSHTWETKE